MDPSELKQKIYDTVYKIKLLNPKDKANPEHSLYKELKELRKMYALILFEKEREEIKENGKHKK